MQSNEMKYEPNMQRLRLDPFGLLMQVAGHKLTADTEEKEKLDTPEFSLKPYSTIGGATVLMDGNPLTQEQVLEKLREGESAKRIVREVWESFYGQGLSVAGFHKNGALEPMDSFFVDILPALKGEDS